MNVFIDTSAFLAILNAGDRYHQQAREAWNELLNFEVFPTGGTEMAIMSAQNFRALKAKGVTIRKTIDCWIATFCLLNGHALLHNDRDYEPFELILGL